MIPEALAQIERAAVLVSDDPVILEHLGDIRLKTGKTEQALDAWRKALAITPNSAVLKKKILDAE